MNSFLGTLEMCLPCKFSESNQERLDKVQSNIREFVSKEGCSWYYRDYQPTEHPSDAFLIDLLRVVRRNLKGSNKYAQFQCFVWNADDDSLVKGRFQLSLSLDWSGLDGTNEHSETKKQKKRKRIDVNAQLMNLFLYVNEEAKCCLPLPTSQSRKRGNCDYPYHFCTNVSVQNMCSSKAVRSIENYLQSKFNRLCIAFVARMENFDVSTILNQRFVRVPMNIDASVNRKNMRLPMLKKEAISNSFHEYNLTSSKEVTNDICSWFGAVSSEVYGCVGFKNDDRYASQYELPKFLAFEDSSVISLKLVIQGIFLPFFQNLVEAHFRDLILRNQFEYAAIIMKPQKSVLLDTLSSIKVIATQGSLFED